MSKTIVIAGASSGFGKGVARALAAQGHHLVLATWGEELLTGLDDEVIQAEAIPIEVRAVEHLERVRDRAINEFGGIDVWINDAGFEATSTFVDIPLEDQIREAETNLLGAVTGSHLATKHFIERGHGTLINISSIASDVAMPYFAVYGATNPALQFLSSSIRQELALNDRKDIHVCVVNPRATDTPHPEHAANDTDLELRMPTIADPQDVISAIVDLINHPRDDVDVSVRMTSPTSGRQLAPELTEDAAPQSDHQLSMAQALSESTLSRSVDEPMTFETGARDNDRERIEVEDEQDS